MITIYSEKKEVRNSAMPLQKKNSMDTESIISDSLIRMRELIKNDLRSVEKIGWRKEEKQLNARSAAFPAWIPQTRSPTVWL